MGGLDVPADRIHMESFGHGEAIAGGIDGVAAEAQVTLDGATRRVPVAVGGQTLLEALRAAHLSPPPFSCQSGFCGGACRARLEAGEVHMRAHMALDQANIAAGQVLTCQSVAQSDRLSLRFDS